MHKILFLSLLVTQSAFATCFVERVTCHPMVNFENIYEIEKVSCSPPGGPVTETKTLKIYNKLAYNQCGPVATRGCLKPMVARELNFYRHLYLQAEIRMDRSGNYILIDDRRTLPQGGFHISTPNASFMKLENYRCNRSYN